MCFCLKPPYFIITVDPLTLNSQPIALQPMPGGSLPNTYIFCIRDITAFLLRSMRKHFSPILGGHFKHQNHHQKAQK